MRAVRFHEFGPPSVLRVEDVPTPVPGPDEVLVEVRAAGINPSDVKNVQGLMPQTTLPRTPGRDFAGVVVQGPAEMRGQEVWGTGGDLGFERDGAHAEFVRLPRTAVSPKPARLSFAEAAVVGVPFVTAWEALMLTAGIGYGNAVLIIGAAGSVGDAAVQIARWQLGREPRSRVIGVVRRESQRAAVESRGAEALVVPEPDGLADAVRAATRGAGANVILDVVGGPMFGPCLRSLAQRGRLVEIATSEREVSLDLLDFYRRELVLAGVNTLASNASRGAVLLQEMAPGFESGALHAPRIAAEYPLSQAPEAYANVAAGAGGKVLLMPGTA